MLPESSFRQATTSNSVWTSTGLSGGGQFTDPSQLDRLFVKAQLTNATSDVFRDMFDIDQSDGSNDKPVEPIHIDSPAQTVGRFFDLLDMPTWMTFDKLSLSTSLEETYELAKLADQFAATRIHAWTQARLLELPAWDVLELASRFGDVELGKQTIRRLPIPAAPSPRQGGGPRRVVTTVLPVGIWPNVHKLKVAWQAALLDCLLSKLATRAGSKKHFDTRVECEINLTQAAKAFAPVE